MARYRRSETAILTVFGLARAEEHLATGTEMRRVMLFDAWSRPRIAVEFTRPPGSEPTVQVYAPRDGGPSADQPLSVGVPGREWQRLMALGANFDRGLAPVVRPRPQPGEDEAIVVCADGGTIVVEAVGAWHFDRALRVRRVIDSTCENGLGDELADQLVEAAVPLLPACGELGRDRFYNGWGILEACLMLRGDRMAAALALNQADQLSNGRPDRARALGLIDEEAVIDWQGERITGRNIERWSERMAEDPSLYLSITRATGQTADRVLVTGVLRRWSETSSGETQLFHAAVSQTWVAEFGRFQLHQMTVGPYELVPDACPPGLLTGAEAANNCRR